MAKKKKRGLSPTFKAGLVVIIVIGIIWAFTTLSNPWYEKPTVTEEPTAPIVMKDEEQNNAVADQQNQQQETKSAEEQPVAEDTTVQGGMDEHEENQMTEDSASIEASATTYTFSDSFDYGIDPLTLDSTKHSWSFKRNSDHTPVVGYNEGVALENYDAFYMGDTSSKVIYLTFDEGYENGYTSQILDTLANNEVQVAFFATEPYISRNPDLVKRMKEEGHVVANHSVHHYDGSSGDGTAITEISPEDVVEELKGVERTMLDKTGYSLDLFFRPPAGLFSDRTLYVTRREGYKTIFWSLAYADWNVNEQKGKDYAYDHVITNVHPGAIILLHAVSESNTEALDSIVKELKAEGYRFGSLYELQSNFPAE